MGEQKKPIITIILVVLNIVVFLNLSFQGSTEDVYHMLEHGAMYVPYVEEHGEYYRLITSMFMHYGFEHLFSNMVALFAMGTYLEPAIGKVKFLLIYLLGGLAGNLSSMWWEYKTYDFVVTAGASGAVFSLTGALLGLAILNNSRVAELSKTRIMASIGISLYIGFSGSDINNAAHIGGLLFGFVMAVLFSSQSHSKHCADSRF